MGRGFDKVSEAPVHGAPPPQLGVRPVSADLSLQVALEALLFAADRPLSVSELVGLFASAHDEEEWSGAVTPEAMEAGLTALAASLADRGIELLQVNEGWRLRTRPDLSGLIRRLWPSRPTRLSKAALEVLSIVAYQQPCTRADVEAIRGVDCGGVLRSLLERKLLKIAGKLEDPGRPLTYATSATFLEVFNLPNLRALPTLRDLESLRVEAEAKSRAKAPEVEQARAAKRAAKAPVVAPSDEADEAED